MKKQPGDFFSSFRNFILPDAKPSFITISNTSILDELVECFDYSCRKESVGNSLLFNMHFIIILHPDVFEERSPSFPVIAKEAVKTFYKRLEMHSKRYEEISPVSHNWFFRFAPGAECYGEKIEKHGLKVMGMLNGLKTSASVQPDRHQTAKVTMKSRATNLFDSVDLHLDVLKNIHFAENNSFQIKFSPDLKLNGTTLQPQHKSQQTKNYNQVLATIKYYTGAGTPQLVYSMKDQEIVIARREDENLSYSNFLLIDSPFVSNPHARIRMAANGGFEIASFSRNETRVNEKPIEKSEPSNPIWVRLTPGSQILINSMVTLEFSTE
ncbi:MAG: FHA domain-containing protein [Gemmatimonadaceae bacterium]|nr:FHA domain-containing protein [Chitinophagaceae bacterium]